jgi:hypothetical protein
MKTGMYTLFSSSVLRSLEDVAENWDGWCGASSILLVRGEHDSEARAHGIMCGSAELIGRDEKVRLVSP